MPYFPQTKVRLLDVPFDMDRKHTLDFASLTEQIDYFAGRPAYEYTGISYQRKPGQANGFVRINRHFDTLQNFNYAMYQNTDYSGKWFFAFISSMEYQNERCTDVYLDFDSYQSWMFDFSFTPSYVEREMIVDDTPGNNIVDEGLQLGEYVHIPADRYQMDSLAVVIGATVDLDNNTFPSVYGTQQVLPSGMKYFAFLQSELPDLFQRLWDLDRLGKADAIQVMWAVPFNFITRSGKSIANASTPATVEWAPDSSAEPPIPPLDGYQPRNGKLLTSPYREMYISNNSGDAATFRYEWFKGAPKFRISTMIAPNATFELVPLNYATWDGYGNQQPEFSLSMPPFPQISWPSNAYANWLAQNANSIKANARNLLNSYDTASWNNGASFIGGLIGSASPNPFSAFQGGLGTSISAMNTQNTLNANFENNVRSLNAKIWDASIQPFQTKGQNGTSSAIIKSTTEFTLYCASIKNVRAQQIDEYFDMFGYATNRLKIPNIRTRPHWNYVKTAYCNLTGPIPSADVDDIRGRFIRGITVWHNPATIYDYSQNNRG